MNELALLVPVLGRPHRVEPLLESIAAATPHRYRVVFIADPDDTEEIAAIEPFVGHAVDILTEPGGYAHKMNEAVKLTEEPFVFFGADDLEFEPGWFEAAVSRMNDGIELVGVNDMIDRPFEHATHFLATRAYAEKKTIDGKPGPFCTEYHHWYCDNELIGTARKRGVYTYAADSVVKHLHPLNAGAPNDETYDLGKSQAKEDRRIYRRRSRRWA